MRTPLASLACALVTTGCSPGEAPPSRTVTQPVEAVPTATAAEPRSGTCLFSDDLKCTEWSGHVAPKRAACEMFGKWTAEPCPMKATSVGVCEVVDGDITGTVYYGGLANAAFAEDDCKNFHGTYHPREAADAAASAEPLDPPGRGRPARRGPHGS